MSLVEDTVSQAAATVNNIRASYQAGKISEVECRELIQDVFDVRRIEELTSDLNVRAEIYTGLKNLYQLTKMILPFI